MAHYKIGVTKKSIITKITSFSSIIVLLSSSLSVILPFILTTPANAIPLYTSNNPNPATYTSVPFTSSELRNNWSPDRTTPSGGYSSGSFYGQSNVLQLGIDSTKANTSSGGYYQYEGIQRQIPASDTIKGSLYVNQAWLNNTVPVRAGLWAVAKDNNNNISAYPIVEFVSAGNGGGSYTGWRAWDVVLGGWTDLTGIGYTANSWNTVEISLNQVTHQFDIYINGQYATANTGDVSTNIGGVIFDNYNYAQNNVNDNYKVDWSNFAYGKYTALAAPTGLGSYTASPSSPIQCGGFTNSYNITADWGAVAGAQGYEFNLIKSPNNTLWTSPLLATPSFSSSFVYGQGLYTYQVRALGANNAWSHWSTSCSVTYDTTAPATPTGLSAKFQYDSSTIPSGSYLNVTSQPTNNNLALFWSNPVDWVTSYHILATFPDGQKGLFYQGPNTNSWLTYNGFGQHGNGLYSYQVVGVNPNGTSLPSASFNLYYDTTKPTVAFTSPTPASNSYVNNNFQVGYTASDNLALKSVNVSLYDTNPAHSSNHWATTCFNASYPEVPVTTNVANTCNVNINGIPDGTYYVQVGAQDQAGNWSVNATRTITIQRSAPATPTGLSAKFQYDSSTIPSGTTLGISSTVDAHGNNLELFWPGPAGWVTGYHILASFPDNTSSLNYQGNNNWAWLYNNNNDGFGQHGNGKYSYTVTAVNPNGLSSPSRSFVLYFSNPKPTVALTNPTPANNSYVNNSFQVGWSANSYNVNLNSVNVSLFDTNPAHSNHWVTTCYQNKHETSASDSGICHIVLPANLTDGTYYIQVGAQDQAGNWSVNATRTITIVRTPPTVSITSPNNISDLTGQVSINGTEITKYPYSYNFVVKDSNNKVIAGPATVIAKSISGWSWDTTKVMNGKYTISLLATDLAGNISNPATLAVTVNNPLAVITMNPLSTTNVNPTINGTVNEQLSSLVVSLNGNTYSASVSSTKNTAGTYNWSVNVTNSLTPNNYSVVITAIDQGGNQSVYNSSITIMPPSLTPQLLTATVKNNVVVPSTSPVTPSSNNSTTNTGSQGHVLGAQIVKPSKSSNLNYKNTNSKPAKHNFFYLGWWWLLILAILLSLLYFFLRKKSPKDQS